MTQPYAEVIGDPIAQSKSPLIHRFWLEKLGLEGDYQRRHVPPDGLAGYLATAREDTDWRGCNVTIPHKIAMMDLVDDPGGLRASIGAMNTIFRGDSGALVGTNTDAAGFVAPIADVDLAGRSVAVIGSGGAARAILFALAQVGAGPVTLLARSALKGAALLSHFGLKGAVRPLATPLPAAALLVNASPLGMAGQPPHDIDLAPLPDDAIVYDIVYAPLETRLLASAEARGLETVDGLDMLVGQAALAFEIFFHAAPPREHDDELRWLLTS
jgi:shikimate dehydrogenase